MYDHSIFSNHEAMLASLRSGLNNDVEFFILLNAVDQNGRNLKSMIGGTSWGASLLQEIDPYQIVQPGDYGVTPLMKMAFDGYSPDEYLAALQSLGVNTDQQDVYGNTTRSISDLKKRESLNTLYFALLTESFRHHPLNANLWDAIVNFPYFPISPRYLFADAIFVVSNQPQQTPVHRAFLQLEAENEGMRREARDLWKAFYRTHDKVVDRIFAEVTEDIEETKQSEERIRTLPIAGRYLNSLNNFGVAYMPEQVTRVLAGNSIFGLNFSRQVTPLEATVVMNSINELAATAATTACTEWQDLYLKEPADLSRFQGFLLTRINKMVDSFFSAYPWEIDETRKAKLLNHRLNQAIVAVSYFLQRTAHGIFEFSNEEDLFSFIDSQLQNRVPVGKTVNSKARVERIKGLLPKGFEFSLLSASSCLKPVAEENKDYEIYGGS